TDLADKLICFVENFSWEDVKDHMLGVLREWAFTDWETVFVAIADDRIVGMTSIMKTDYYPLPEIYPWISSVFVTEDYRGYRISEKLIDFANKYAREIGFERTYIPTEFIGLYEKYGYCYIKDIMNYGNGIDRLYAKELK
ncbi:MAG: GNAT family N-acetyltransferase, partial [Eubacterium sp.]